MLEQEYAYYEKNKEDFRRHYMGKFVAIVGSELIGAFDEDQTAYEAAVQAKGNVPMLIKKVTPDDGDEIFVAPALFLGLIHATL